MQRRSEDGYILLNGGNTLREYYKYYKKGLDPPDRLVMKLWEKYSTRVILKTKCYYKHAEYRLKYDPQNNIFFFYPTRVVKGYTQRIQ